MCRSQRTSIAMCVEGNISPAALRCRQGFGHVVPILGRVVDILHAAGRDTPVDMAALLKRESLDVIGEPLPTFHTTGAEIWEGHAG